MAKYLTGITQKFMLRCNLQKYKFTQLKFIIHKFYKNKFLLNFKHYVNRRKEALEKEMQMIEKDLEKINSNNVIIDLTKW